MTIHLGDHLLTEKLNESIRLQRMTDKKYNMGLAFHELQKIVQNWNARLSIVQRGPKFCVCQIQFEK